ncbi:flagellar FlbD family protein [Timonella senegalensis]|uniref:flagellar FlbD family protein n=1 Tax=Timonella senegalensis TaxID=1465825 RepID=UPI0028A63AB2|nr:flagellar FlbD family protein [Timonella senegalensis]
MIVVSKLSRERFAVNPDLIQRIDSAPDTILTLVDGTKYIVSETMHEVIELIDDHRASIIARAQQSVTEAKNAGSTHLALIQDDSGED